MATTGRIKWRVSDAETIRNLAKAFNRKVRAVKRENPHLAEYQPSEISYKEMIKELKNSDRADFNRTVSKYSRYLRDGAELPYTTQQGVNITLWEKREIDNTFRAINARNKAAREKAERLASPFTGTMYTLEDVRIMPRKNTIQEITPRHWDEFVRDLERSAKHSTQGYRENLYKQNFLRAIENNLGRDSKLYSIIKSISADKLTEFYYTDPVISINFTYDPREVQEIEEIMLDRLEREGNV